MRYVRLILRLSWAAAVVLVAGCGGGNEFIPLAKVDAPKQPPPPAKLPKAPGGVPISPPNLIYK